MSTPLSVKNIKPYLKDAIQERSLEDLGQAVLGAALFIPGINGGVVVIGGTVLFAWEMAEFIKEH